ncbi:MULTISPECIES: F0F1 ATP synthase subunit B [Spirulina sp. CCY15215]|uniref:F0F1 ATP synthase subunit B n=1 Tax=Spirulina sp. CCY15215 TaxID=2767591 RepID=UPI00194FCD74
MGTVFYLATEAEHGFGLNFNFLEANIINLALLLGILVYYGGQAVGKILTERRAKIEAEIQEAEGRASKAAAELAGAQQKLAQAKEEAKQILATAEKTAQRVKEEILAQGNVEVERMRANASADVSSEQDKAIAQLRQRTVALAIERAEGQLKDRLDDSKQERLIDRCIGQLGG